MKGVKILQVSRLSRLGPVPQTGPVDPLQFHTTPMLVLRLGWSPTSSSEEVNRCTGYLSGSILWLYFNHNLQGPAWQIVIWLIQRPSSILVHLSIRTWGAHHTSTSQNLSVRSPRCRGGSSQPRVRPRVRQCLQPSVELVGWSRRRTTHRR